MSEGPMNSKKLMVPFQGKMVEGEEISFKEIAERWNEYELDDGAKLRMKSILAKVVRTDQYNELNEPIYLITTTYIMNVTVPEELKKKGN
jgi:hypothetical protein